MTTLTLVRGLPGSGKSTHAQNLAETRANTIHLEADMYHTQNNGRYVFDRKNVRTAHEWCQLTTQILLFNNVNVVVSNTFVKRWEITPYITIASLCDAYVEIVHMEGDYGNQHSVPEEVIERMQKNWEDYA